MVAIYVRWVKKHKMTIDEVPARWREKVRAKLATDPEWLAEQSLLAAAEEAKVAAAEAKAAAEEAKEAAQKLTGE